MESTKATSLLNEIMQKLSLLTKEDELAQGIEEIEVQEEVVELEEQEQPAEAPEESQEEQEELSEEPVEATEELEEETELMAGYVKQEEFESKMEAMEAKLAAMAKMIDEEMGGYKKEKEMMSKQIEELSAEPAAEAIKHDPEAETPEKKVFTYGGNRTKSTFDRVMERIGNQ
jgi:hypothetical protein